MNRTADFKSPPLEIDKTKNIEQAQSNCLFLNPALYQQFVAANKGAEPVYGQLNEFVFILKAEKAVDFGKVAIPGSIRNCLKLSPTLDKPVISWYDLPKQTFMLGSLKFTVATPTLKPEDKVEIAEEELINYFRKAFVKHFIGTGQEFYVQLKVRRFNLGNRLPIQSYRT